MSFASSGNRQVLLIPNSQKLLINLSGRPGIRGLDQGPWTAFTVDRLAAPLYSLEWEHNRDELVLGVNSTRSSSVWKLDTGEMDDREIPADNPGSPGAGAGPFALANDGSLMAFYVQCGFPNDSIVVTDRKRGGVLRDIPVELSGKDGSGSQVDGSRYGRTSAAAVVAFA